MHRRKLRSIKKSQQVVPTFLSKTYQILEKPENFNIISWNENGQQFSVKNITQFTEKILPHYFKHSNFSSFIRQLNMYGFHKIKSDNIIQTFKHQKFVRNKKQILSLRRHLLSQIKRKVMNDVTTKDDKMDGLQIDKIKDVNFGQQILNMKKKQEELEKIVDVLVQQNKQILQDNKHLWSKMKKTVEKEEKKIQNVLFLMLLSGKNFNNQKLNQLQIKEKPYLIQQANQRTNVNGDILQKNQAILPIQESSKQNALEAFYRNLTNKKSKSKTKFQDQLFLHNQGEHIKIINDLMNQMNNNKKEENVATKPNMLQIQGIQKHLNNHTEEEALNAPLSPMNFSPFLKKFPESNQYMDDDDLLNKFVLEKSQSDFPIEQGKAKLQSDLDEFIIQK